MSDHDKTKGPRFYPVGYGKPPIDTRFKKGQSGNPAGRRKGSKNLSTVLREIFQERVFITENGKRKKVSKLELLIKKLYQIGVNGDLRAISQLATLAMNLEQNAEQGADPAGVFDERDRKTALSILKHYEQSTNE
jgi:hypothetical protein